MASSNYPQGISNVYGSTTMGNLVQSDPTRCHVWMDDFDDYTAAEWIITEVGSGTRAVADADGGVLVITNAAADDDHNNLQWSGNTSAAAVETWTWSASRSMWYKARFKVNNATESEIALGLTVIDTDPYDVSDGLFFVKADGSTSLVFRAEKSGTASTVTAGTLANDTYVTVGFYWDADIGQMTVFFNDGAVGTITSTTNMPTTEMTITMAIQNGTDSAAIMSVDYICVIKDRQAPNANGA